MGRPGGRAGEQAEPLLSLAGCSPPPPTGFCVDCALVTASSPLVLPSPHHSALCNARPSAATLAFIAAWLGLPSPFL